MARFLCAGNEVICDTYLVVNIQSFCDQHGRVWMSDIHSCHVLDIVQVGYHRSTCMKYAEEELPCLLVTMIMQMDVLFTYVYTWELQISCDQHKM